MLIGLVSTLAALLIGVSVGAIAGYFGGWIDSALMRFTELFQSVPSFALAIVLVAIFEPSVSSIVTGQLFLLPLIRAFLGDPAPLPQPLTAPLAADVGPTGPRMDFEFSA